MTRKNSIKNLLKEIIPQNKLDLVNRSFEIVGDIAITEIPKEIIAFEKEIGNAILKANSHIKVVLKKSGIHHGEFRTQNLEHIAGENRKETIYNENQIKLKINPETVYFSSKLSTERENLVKNLKPKQKVLVMFSGCGPYTFVALRKQKDLARITSIEINPQGHKYALESLELNKNILKKSQIYKQIIKFLKENHLQIKEKEIISNLNQLKILFLNGDVRKITQDFSLPKEEKINNNNKLNFDNENFNISKKEEFSKFNKNQTINLDLDKKIPEEILINYILNFDNFNFLCKIKNKYFKFESLIEKRYLLNILESLDFNQINKYDEIFMPLPKDAQLFLDSAFNTIAKNGTIHMYDFLHENEFPHKSENAIIEASKKFNRKIKIISTRKVGQYAPGKYRVCCDFQVLD